MQLLLQNNNAEAVIIANGEFKNITTELQKNGINIGYCTPYKYFGLE